MIVGFGVCIGYICTLLPEFGDIMMNLLFEHLDTEIEYDLNPVKPYPFIKTFYKRQYYRDAPER